MFVSLFMILLAFFILLNSIADIQQERKKKALQSLGGAFGHMPSGLSLFDSPTNAPNPPGPPLRVEEVEIRLVRQLRQIFTGLLGSGVDVRPAATGRGAVIEVDSPTVFSGTSTDLPQALADRIRRVADLIQAAQVDVSVRGYTNLRLRSSFRHALWVSGRRAQKVARLFLKRGVPMDRVRLEGLGDLRPAAAEFSEQGREKNERVQIRLQIMDDTSLKPLFPKGSLAPTIKGGAPNGQEG